MGEKEVTKEQPNRLRGLVPSEGMVEKATDF